MLFSKDTWNDIHSIAFQIGRNCFYGFWFKQKYVWRRSRSLQNAESVEPIKMNNDVIKGFVLTGMYKNECNFGCQGIDSSAVYNERPLCLQPSLANN